MSYTHTNCSVLLCLRSLLPSHVLNDVSFLEIFKCILRVLFGMLQSTYSWMRRRHRNLSGSLSPLILGRLNCYGNRPCMCVFSCFLHAAATFGEHCSGDQPFFAFRSYLLCLLYQKRNATSLSLLRSLPAAQ